MLFSLDPLECGAGMITESRARIKGGEQASDPPDP